MKFLYKILLIIVAIEVNGIKFYKSVRPLPVFEVLPCPDSVNVVTKFKSDLKDGYNITMLGKLNVATDVRLTFDSAAAIFVSDEASISSTEDNVYNIYRFLLLKSSENLTLTVKGLPAPYSPPYLTSLKIDGNEFCYGPNLTYFEDLPTVVKKRINVPDRYCGKRKVLHTELIVNGISTKPGDWPWHVAIYRREQSTLKYICGGTLLSKHFVLTAAHCTTISGVRVIPDILGVFAGKYHLFTSDRTTQEIEVFQVIVHDEYNHKNLKNDISLLKLKTEAVFNNYVQPACIWYEEAYDKLPSYDLDGTVVGWGFDQTDSLSSTLHAANMPIIPNLSCIYSNPIFYSNVIRDGKKFCAGYGNGTSACNGDSGGGFLIFIPDSSSGDKNGPGAWYVRGIVSQSPSRKDAVTICDPHSYGVYTDVSRYTEWIRNYMSTS